MHLWFKRSTRGKENCDGGGDDGDDDDDDDDKPVPMAARSNARTVFNRSNTGIVVSNPDRGMDVSAFFCVVLSFVGCGLATG
jgi:hypothetical protein